MAPGAGTPAGLPVHGSDTDDGRRIRVVLADDSYPVREALIHVLAGSDRIELAGVCGEVNALCEAIDEGLHVAAALRGTDLDVGP
jgi:hypothetical protein